MLPSGVWKSGSNYTFLDVVTHSGSSYVAKNNINNSTKAPPSDTTNWQLIATGYPGNAAGVSAKDTQGMVVTSGSNSTVQALIDAIADKVMTKLLAKTDIVQTESTATNKVPSSAYLKQVKADINSNLPYIDTSKKIKDGFANGTSWAATEDCIVCGSIGFNSSAQGCNVLINGINIFWVNNDVTVNSSMPIWFSVRKGDTVRFIGYNSQVPNLTNLYAFSTK